MTYILDTNMCIFWLKNVGKVRQEVAAHTADRITTNIVSVAELYFGVENSAEQYRQRNHENLEALLAAIGYIPVSVAAAQFFGQHKAALRKLGQPIADLDLMIAAIALAEQAILVTDNLKHFERIPGLRLENWK